MDLYVTAATVAPVLLIAVGALFQGRLSNLNRWQATVAAFFVLAPFAVVMLAPTRRAVRPHLAPSARRVAGQRSRAR